MFRSKHRKSRKEEQRFYLFPGQGGRAYRRKQVFILKWSVIAGLLVSVVLSVVMYFVNRQKPH